MTFTHSTHFHQRFDGSDTAVVELRTSARGAGLDLVGNREVGENKHHVQTLYDENVNLFALNQGTTKEEIRSALTWYIVTDLVYSYIHACIEPKMYQRRSAF
jgi:hypothetical protein